MAFGAIFSGLGAGAKSLRQSRMVRQEQAAKEAERAALAQERQRRAERENLTLEMALRDKGYVPESEATGPDGMLDPGAQNGPRSVSGKSLDDIVSAASGVPTMGMAGVSPRYKGGPKGFKFDGRSDPAQKMTLDRRIQEANLRKIEREGRAGPASEPLVPVMRNGQKVYASRADAVGQEVPGAEEKPGDPNPIRGQFNSDSIFKDAQLMAQSLGKIKAAKATPAGDMSLVFNFMKMMDPGSSVREGEYATVQNSGGVPDRVRNLYNRAISGEMLQPGQRQDFISQAEGITAAQRRLLKGVITRYTDIANRAKLNPADIVSDPFATFDEPAPTYSPDNPFAPRRP